QVQGVEPTYAAACGFSDPETGSEGLAIFFSPEVMEMEANIELIKAIRAKVSHGLGVSPAYVVPVPIARFPKTTSGKIQRTSLRNDLLSGRFDNVVKEIDVRLQNANTVPNWFFRKVWVRNSGRKARPAQATGTVLVFSDNIGLADELCRLMHRRSEAWVNKSAKQTWVTVTQGSEFERIGRDRYRINPAEPTHYHSLIESLRADQLEVNRIFHLWTYELLETQITSAESLVQSQDRGVCSLLLLAQSLAQDESGQTHVRMTVVSSRSQVVDPSDQIAYWNASLPGFIRTLPQEFPWLACSHVDIAADSVETSAELVANEIGLLPVDIQVAYRSGERFVPRLERVDFTKAPKQPLPIKQNGMFLITGGMGGIGSEIAKFLLTRHHARLLLVGRTKLPDRGRSEGTRLGAAESKLVAAYEELERIGGDFIYEAADVSEPDELARTMRRAKALWNSEFDGVLHLAGLFRERRLIDEDPISLRESLKAKLAGSWVLDDLLGDNDEAIFVSFSSVNSFFGGVGVGAYSAANSFLEGFTEWRERKVPGRNYCFHWSQWDETGMSQGYKMKHLTAARGYESIQPSLGISSLLAGLANGQLQLIVGLNGVNPHIRRYCAGGRLSTRKLTAYFSTRNGDLESPVLRQLALRDRFEHRINCEFLQLKEIPVNIEGAVDIAQLAGRTVRRVSAEHAAPQSELEGQLASVWREVLGIPSVGVNDNFFEIGGHSLMAVKLVFRIRNTLGFDLPLDKVIETPTIRGMARSIEENGCLSENAGASLRECVLSVQPSGNKRPFFCVHPAGGSPLCYLNLALHVGRGRPFYGFQSPGLLDDREPLKRVEDIAALYADAIRSVQPTGPYLVGGWSSGGPVAFEVARILEGQNQRVGLLAFLDCGLMHSDMPARNWNPRNPINFLKAIAVLLNFAWQIGLPRSYAQIRGLAQFVGISLPPSIREILRRDFSSKLKFLRTFKTEALRAIRVFNANTLAGLKYEPRPYGGKATLFRATSSEAGGSDPVVDDLRKFAASGVEYHSVSGNHMSIILDPDDSRVLAQKLSECLDRVDNPD
ncbi:MAG TPA: alpha/beta fold hydrolase, partial [Blastocatellia bacterium]|nr:alpha/beta fold hydrolase [Blastocatellia bacterium]